ncbi:MAG TPA: adenylate/guanylate cyclase domain-containing protein [Propionibacteriaceae bacterium]|nr:adenylate/guanylate cyclase domain-containing protein [Propionibacteriaceae bacterium]
MTDLPISAEGRLARLLERLLNAAEASLAAGDLEPARATAEEVRAVDPDNRRAALILQRVATRPVGPAGERALMTLVFSDIVGSTMLSERVEPEQLRDLFSSYRAAAREAVQRYRGHVMQYSGDGILAGFGYPEPHEDDARRAVLAALDLVVAMRDARADLDRRLGVAPDIRVGIHTGRVVVTDLSDDRSVAERDSIVGIVPNFAARIQQAAEPGMVVISDVTQQLVDADFYLHSLGERELKGISRLVEVFAVERPRYAGARFEAERYRKAGLVGRDQPRDRMLAAWEAIREQAVPAASSTFLVVGEAGIGKSRLVAEVLDRVEASSGRVLGLGCLPYYTNVSLWPITQTLERLLGVASEAADRLLPLVSHLTSLGLDPARFVPFLGPLIGVTQAPEYPAPELDPSAFLDETLSRIVEWLGALSDRTPHLFVVEDLHWADPSTLGLLGRLVDRRPRGILTIATTRDDSVIPWRDSVEVLQLGHLDGPAALRLVDNIAAGKELPSDQRASIVRLADGIPLVIEELTRFYLDENRTEAMPLRLQELFTWRLKSPGVDLRVVQIAATVGPTFDADTVSEVVGAAGTVAEQLRILADNGIIEPGDPDANIYRFRHALLRDAAYETQVLDVRSQTHARVAETIADRGAEPALIAEHLDLAGQAQRAASLYIVAAQAEQGRGAHTEATRLLSRALELLETLPESDDRDLNELTARMLRALSVSSMQGYAAHDVQVDHRWAEELTKRLGTRPEVLPSIIAIWAYWLTSGDLPTARGLIDRLTDMLGQEAFSWFEPEVESCAGFQDFYEGHLELAREHLERSIAGFTARPSDQAVSPFWPLPNDPIAVGQIALASVSTLRGELEDAAHWEREALRRGEEIGFPRCPFSRAFVMVYAAWMRRFLGDDKACFQLGSEVVAIGQEYGYVFWTTLGSVYIARGAPGGEAHREFLQETVTTLRLMGQEAFAASNLGYLARLHAAAGDIDSAQDVMAEALDAVRKSGEHVHLPELLRQRAAYTLAGRGDTDEAVADLREAVYVATEQGARVARLRAALELARLPESLRPKGWRILLEEARSDMPASFVSDETAVADDLLAG